MLTAAVAKSGDVAAVQRAIDVRCRRAAAGVARHGAFCRASTPGCRRWARGGGRGGRGGGGGGGGLPGLSAPGGRVAVTPGRGVSLPAEPAALTKLAAGTDDDRVAGEERRRQARLAGPAGAGRRRRRRSPPSSRSASTPAPSSTRTSALGCHQEDGRGKDKLGAQPRGLALREWRRTRPRSIRILVGGKEGPIGLMPPLGPALNDEQIAVGAHVYPPRVGAHRLGRRPADRHGSARPVEGPHQAVDRRRTAGRRRSRRARRELGAAHPRSQRTLKWYGAPTGELL